MKMTIGDQHQMGLTSTTHILSAACGADPSKNDPLPLQPCIFLGDALDRGWQSVETIALLCQMKIELKDALKLIRGNHEVSRAVGCSWWRRLCREGFSLKRDGCVLQTMVCCIFCLLFGDRCTPAPIRDASHTLR